MVVNCYLTTPVSSCSSLMLSRSCLETTTSTSQFSGTCRFCVSIGVSGSDENTALGPGNWAPVSGSN